MFIIESLDMYFVFRFVGSDNIETYFSDTERSRVVSYQFHL